MVPWIDGSPINVTTGELAAMILDTFYPVTLSTKGLPIVPAPEKLLIPLVGSNVIDDCRGRSLAQPGAHDA
jgi:hypothetical protein